MKVDIVIGTLRKAPRKSVGRYILGKEEIIKLSRQRSRTYALSSFFISTTLGAHLQWHLNSSFLKARIVTGKDHENISSVQIALHITAQGRLAFRRKSRD